MILFIIMGNKTAEKTVSKLVKEPEVVKPLWIFFPRSGSHQRALKPEKFNRKD